MTQVGNWSSKPDDKLYISSQQQDGCGMNSVFSDDDLWSSAFNPVEKLKTNNWVVLMHSPGIGTFAPSFPNIDEAEEFSNAMRVCTDDVAISEPIPVVKTETVKINKSSFNMSA